ncbi:hypothetical protein MMG00_04080 [Ignatzschineria rhizosphaerae]|uniref:Uncharacterized protein n=1 Tax=Ignatzschineria rhizosphaerae TaxID=2923279 RepID=A0ABY3X5L0_9GAMM|nr:hypothetical protein [Ignatzschineria rhizosphaerae]UNM97039.1 hypothetical protein MMG00_04080 [Ignatzschineria rhizosphaerae]
MSDNSKLLVISSWILQKGQKIFIEHVILNHNIKNNDKKQMLLAVDGDRYNVICNYILGEDFDDDELTNFFIENVSFILPDLNIASKRFYKTLYEEQKLLATWMNIDLFFKKTGDVPSTLISNNYKELVSNCQDSTYLKDNYLNFILLNNELSYEAYCFFVQTLEFNAFELTSYLSWNKIHFVYQNKLLKLNDTTVNSLFSQLDDDENNYKLLIRIIGDEIGEDIQEKMRSWFWIGEEGSQTLRKDFLKAIFSNNEFITLKVKAFTYCLQGINWGTKSDFENSVPISRLDLLHICRKLKNDILRVELINNFFNTIIKNGKIHLRQFFNTFDADEFRKLGKNSYNKPKIENNVENNLLVMRLVEKEIVEIKSEDEKMFYLTNKTLKN